MQNLNKIKSYTQYIMNHRRENKNNVRATKKNYNSEVRGCIWASILAHDLDKLFTLKLFDYVDIYTDIMNNGMVQHRDIFNRPFSTHDQWIYSHRAIELLKSMELFKYLSCFDRSSYISSDEEIDEIVDNINTLCEVFGEDPRAFYLRNYNCFKFGNASLARRMIEFQLDIDFDDYFVKDRPLLTVYEVFDKNNKHFMDGYAYHVFVTCLVHYGVNVYESLGLTDTYVGINDKI